LLHSFMVVRVFKQNASYFTMAMASWSVMNIIYETFTLRLHTT
jgi:hypothetical protein